MKKLIYTILLFLPLALFGQTAISYQLSAGWNMVGFTACGISPIEETVNSSLGNDASISETFNIIKDVRGKFWHPSLGENSTLTELIPGEGYMMYVNGATTSVQFSEEYCNDITYQLNSGWNMVAFTGDVDADNYIVSSMDSALGNGADIANIFLVIKKINGQFWSETFTLINYLTSGEAYIMYVNGEPTTVSFTENSTQVFENNPDEEFTLPTTDNNMSVVFPSGSFLGLEGAQIHAITMDEQIVISEIYTINDDGSVGVSLIGTDNLCGCDLANSSTQPVFVIENGEVSSYVFANQLQYTANWFQVINDFDIYGNCDSCIGPAFGCTDVNSDNYNSSSLLGNGTCYRYGCKSDWADNFDILATIDDGSCYKYGCMLDWADNYNINATNDDDSCYKLGCTNVLALNYDVSVTDNDGSCEYEIITQLTMSYNVWNVSINLQEGWNMFGYGCPISIDLVEGFSNHIESITLIKDNSGSVYMPEFGFNGIGDLTPGYGYQIKVTEAIEGFSLCDWYVNDIPEDNIVSLQEEVENLQAELDSIYGCTYSWACNYNEDAILNDGSCYDNDIGCGCDTPLPSDGYDCYGNQLIANIGDTVFGGIVFFIDSTGQHGLVAAMEDLTEGATDPYGWGEGYVGYEWGCSSIGIGISNEENWEIGAGYQNTVHIINSQCNTENGGVNAAQACINHESEGYSDWYLPSKYELMEMYNAIGDVGNFIISQSGWYWSSTEALSDGAWGLFTESASGVVEGVWGNPSKYNPGLVRPIRSF